MIENWGNILTIVNTVFIVLIIIVLWIYLDKKPSKNKENSSQSDDQNEQQEIQSNQEKQLIPEQHQQQSNRQDHQALEINEFNQFQKNNDKEIYQSNQNLQNKEKELKDTQQLYKELKQKIESTSIDFNQFKQQYENQSKDKYQKLQNDVESISNELNQLKQQSNQEIMPNNKIFQDIQNETNEKYQSFKNDITQKINDFKKKYDQEFAAINQKLIEIPNQEQLKKMVKQIESLESCCKRLDENCSTTNLNLQSQQQDIKLTLEQISKTRINFEQHYNKTDLPNLLKFLQDLEGKIIELIKEIFLKGQIIIPFDLDRLQKTQNFVYKLYEESSNKRAVYYQYKYFVRETVNFEEMAQNYSLPFSPKVELKKYCKSYKPVRGDGNCFYTAFVYQFVEFVICSYNQIQYQQFVQHCFDINLPMRLKINKYEPESVDEQLQKQLLLEFLYRLQEIRKIENLDERRKVYEKQFAAFEKQNEQIDGCLYALASIFIRNYTDYAVEFHEHKEVLFDRANLLIWEEECESSTEVVMQSLQKKLSLNIQLIFIQKDNSILVNKYENNSQYNMILILKPGHYGIGYFNPLPLPEEVNYDNYLAFLKQLSLKTFKNQPELVILNLVRFLIKAFDYLNQQSQNIIKVGSVPLEQQNIY